MAQSFHDRILRVNLTSATLSEESPGEHYFRRYMGGWNTIADVLLNEVPKGVDPLGPKNKLIFAPGILTGLPVSGASRNAVGAKSPLTGAFGGCEVGGFWGAELKRAGYDAIIIEGQAEKPVYLWLHDEEAEIRDAEGLWGLATLETQTAIRDELDDRRIRCAMIGPAGENLVRYACIMNGTYDAAGRAGLGAVMGSKKLKAVAVRGTQALGSADPDRIRELARDMAQGVRDGEKAAGLHQWGTGAHLPESMATGNLPVRNFRDGTDYDAAPISADVFMPQIGTGMDACYACAVRCKKVVEAEDHRYQVIKEYGGPEYESAGALGSCCGVDDIIAVSKATQLCNAYSLDTIGTGVTIAMAMECYENGLLTDEDTDGLDLSFGNGDAVVEMVERIARREGLGDILAKGTLVAAREIGNGAERYAMQVKNQAFPMHEPRFKRGLAIGYAVSPTGADHCHSLHDTALVNVDDDGFVADAFLQSMGVLEAMPLEDLGPGKTRATFYNNVRRAMINCLPMCLFVPWSARELVDLMRAATGWEISAFELLKVGERARTLARVFNAREGFTDDDDYLPQRSYGPTTGGALADGGIDPDELDEALRMYYVMFGWDRESGLPMTDTLHELDISWAAEYLPVQ